MGSGQKYPTPQLAHVAIDVAVNAVEYVPYAQAILVVGFGQYLPEPQFKHVDTAVAFVAMEYLPAPHCTFVVGLLQ